MEIIFGITAIAIIVSILVWGKKKIISKTEARNKKILESYKNNQEVVDTCKKIAEICKIPK